jgi:hypothetical protein
MMSDNAGAAQVFPRNVFKVRHTLKYIAQYYTYALPAQGFCKLFGSMLHNMTVTIQKLPSPQVFEPMSRKKGATSPLANPEYQQSSWPPVRVSACPAAKG